MSSSFKPVTVRLKKPAYMAIQEIAAEHNLSVADVMRKCVDQELAKYLHTIRYIDVQQGRDIQHQLMVLSSTLQNIRDPIVRISINYNQDVKMRHIALKSAPWSEQQEREAELCQKKLMSDMGVLLRQYYDITQKLTKSLCRILV